MITPKIKALFLFIEFLHSNIENFKKYDEVINKLHLLDKERQKISSKKTFKDKLKYDEVQEQIKDKFKVIQENILQPIQAKANELNICDLKKTETLWNWNSTEILELKENFSRNDLPEIFSHKNKYLEYRTETKGEVFFELGFFFDNLDEVLKSLFDFFKETDQNEFEAFETKTIQVNNIREAVEIINNKQNSMEFNAKIDWVKYYLEMDVEKPKLFEPEIIVGDLKNSLPENKALLSQYIYKFKKDTYLLCDENLKWFIKQKIDEIEQNSKIPNFPFAERGNEASQMFIEGVTAFLNFLQDLLLFYENKIYLIKDGKQVISDWEFMQQTGMIDRMKQKQITINPTHSFELLKQTRIELFEKAKQNFLEERKMKKLATSVFEINLMYSRWLNNELRVIEFWLSDKYPNGEKKCKPSTSDQIEILKYKQFVKDEIVKTENNINPPQPIVKQKPEPNEKLITLKNSETIEKIHSELKGYFPNKEAELLKALKGEQLSELLLFPHNQNRFVEVFRRLKYNGFLLNTDTETRNWICTTFQFIKKGFAEPQPFNESSVWDNLNKGKGEPTKKARICNTEWLPYKSPLQLTRETENEKL